MRFGLFIISKNAPPAVEIYVKSLMYRDRLIAATVSPPPATDKILPLFVSFDKVFAIDAVPT